MPEVRYYEIDQTRRVKVAANNEETALRIANNSFDGNSSVVDEWGHALGHVDVIEVHISREHI